MNQPRRLVDITAWKAAPDAERAGVGVLKATAFGARALDPEQIAEVKDLGGDPEMTLSFVLSDEGRDRDGDRIKQDGWDLSHFKSNPVVPFAHDYKSLPVAKALKTWVGNSTDKGPQLKALKQFTRPDENPHGALVHKLCKGGYLNACSVGFIPTAHEPDSKQPGDDDGARVGYLFHKAQLLESSIVPVPSNPRALHDAKSFGIDLSPMVEWCERILDGEKGDGLWVPRHVLEESRLVAKGSKTLIFTPGSASSPSLHSPAPAPAVKAPAAQEAPKSVKAAVPYARRTLDEEGAGYDEATERAAALPGQLYWMAAVYDAERADDPASYQLLHHRAADCATNWNAVQAAMAACLGGGVSAADKPFVYQHLANHYRDFRREPPELKDYSAAELKALFPEQKQPEKAEALGGAQMAISSPETCLAALNACADYLFSGPELSPEQAMRIDNAIDLADGACDLILESLGVPDPGEDDDDDDGMRSAPPSTTKSESEPPAIILAEDVAPATGDELLIDSEAFAQAIKLALGATGVPS